MSLVCKVCGKAILPGTDYQECPICKRAFHIDHNCPIHPNEQMERMLSDSNRRFVQNPRRIIRTPQTPEQRVYQPQITTTETTGRIPAWIKIIFFIVIVILGLNMIGSLLNPYSTSTSNTSYSNSQNTSSSYETSTSNSFNSTGNSQSTSNSNGSSSNCSETPTKRMSIGMKGRVTYRNNVALMLRSEPHISEDTFIKNLREGTRIEIIGGPVCADGFIWWNIRTQEGANGWSAEGGNNEYYMEPFNW